MVYLNRVFILTRWNLRGLIGVIPSEILDIRGQEGNFNMATETATAPAQSNSSATSVPNNQASQFWCNFCDFRTDDANAYLAHSCADVLAARGVEVKPTGKNECS